MPLCRQKRTLYYSFFLKDDDDDDGVIKTCDCGFDKQVYVCLSRHRRPCVIIFVVLQYQNFLWLHVLCIFIFQYFSYVIAIFSCNICICAFPIQYNMCHYVCDTNCRSEAYIHTLLLNTHCKMQIWKTEKGNRGSREGKDYL